MVGDRAGETDGVFGERIVGWSKWNGSEPESARKWPPVGLGGGGEVDCGGRIIGTGTGGTRGAEIAEDVDGTGTGGRGYSRDPRATFSRDLLRFRKSFVKLFTDMRGLVADADADSSDPVSPETAESAEKRLEGWGRENVRGGGSRTAGVAGRAEIE